MMCNEELKNPQAIPGIYDYRGGVLRSIDSGLGFNPRISNRILLHQLGLCGMFTAIVVDPHEYLGLEELQLMAAEASRVNERIGLPSRVNSMVIRSRDASPTGQVSGTNPMLIVNNIYSSWPEVVALGKEGEMQRFRPMFNPVSEWRVQGIKVPSNFLIHDENAIEQRRAVHARVGKLSDGSFEISMGTGVLHARQLGNDGYPYISMVGHDLEFLIEDVLNGSFLTVKTLNSRKDGTKLVERVSGYVDKIRWGVEAVSRIVGRSVVVEMRIYDGKAGLQMYDFDYKFSVQESGTISGLTASPAFLAVTNRLRGD